MEHPLLTVFAVSTLALCLGSSSARQDTEHELIQRLQSILDTLHQQDGQGTHSGLGTNPSDGELYPSSDQIGLETKQSDGELYPTGGQIELANDPSERDVLSVDGKIDELIQRLNYLMSATEQDQHMETKDLDVYKNPPDRELYSDQNKLASLLERVQQELDGERTKEDIERKLLELAEYQTQGEMYGPRNEIELNDENLPERAFDDDAYKTDYEKNKTSANQDKQIKRLVKKVLKKVAKKLFEKIKPKLEIKLLKVTSRVLAKIAKKTGIKLLARLGLKAGKKAAIKAATRLAAKSGQLATKAAATSALGPAGPFVEAAMLAFDILSIGLDLADAGGYMKMGTIAEYTKIKREIQKKLKEAIEEDGGDFPSIAGPFDNLSDEECRNLVNDTVQDMLNLDNDNAVLDNVVQKITSDILDKQTTEQDIEDDSKIERYADIIDSDQVLDVICISLGGKVVDTGTLGTRCSYKDRTSCESSYSWPLAEETDEIYAEYKDEIYGGACVAASYALRSICESNDLPYDSEIGICKIDEKYCKMKGAEWKYSDDVKQYDCVIGGGQKFAEMLFGTTVVRGLKQIFDPDQYEKCKANEIDDGYFCRIVFCPEGEEQWASGGICYPKCEAGYHPVGCCICSPDCPDGWTDDGATCRRAGFCEDNKDHDGALCYDKCKAGFNGVGPVCWKKCPEGYKDIGALCSKGGEVTAKPSRPADKKPCPAGLRDDGTSCWKDTYGRGVGRIPDKKPCPSGMRDDGTSCWLDTYGRGVGRIPDKSACPPGLRDDGTSCWSDAHIYGKGCCCTLWGCCNKCKSGYHDDGCTCRKTDVGIKVTLFARQKCRSNEDKCGALCYPKCRSGFHNVGCNLCAPNGGPGIKVTLGQRHSCNGDEELHGALCYKKCKNEYRAVGCCLCEPNGGPGIKVTLFQRQYCGEGETNVAGICWGKCKEGCKDDGATCRVPLSTMAKESYGRGVGSPDTVIKGKDAAVGRGVGKPAVHIRPKRRIIPFSTRDN